MTLKNKFDYIVVGAGSAGCVLANRLSADPSVTVLLVEAGGSDKHPWVQIPIGYGRAFFHDDLNWRFRTEPDPQTANRCSYWPRGKVIGGSSAINAMVYIRGHARDYDDWAAAGNTGWSWQDVLPYFRKLETNPFGDSAFHGASGPVRVTNMQQRAHPVCQHYLNAGKQIGLEFNPDFNGEIQDGIGIYQATIYGRRRMSAARAYLETARSRPNLTVLSRAMAQRIVFKGNHASSVVVRQKGRQCRYGANREVVLSAGAIGSPQLLMLSGIGPGEVMQQFDIAQVLVQPMVGQNLQDHLAIDNLYRCRVPTINNQLSPWWGKLWQGIRYLLTGAGPLAMSVNQGGGFVRSNCRVERPNMQLYFSPASYTNAPPGARPLMNPDRFAGFLLGIQPTRPTSRGYLSLRSPRPDDPPLIVPNYLTTEHDWLEMLEGAHYLRKLAAAPSLAEIIEQEILPGTSVNTDEELREDIANRAGTVFHPISSCRMSPDPSAGVVAPDLHVHGATGLRVVDASVFPGMISGNTNAPVIMLAEKAADILLSNIKR